MAVLWSNPVKDGHFFIHSFLDTLCKLHVSCSHQCLHPVSPFPFSFYQNNLDGSSIIAQAYALSAREPKKDRTSFISAQVPEDVTPDQGGQEKNPHGPPLRHQNAIVRNQMRSEKSPKIQMTIT